MSPNQHFEMVNNEFDLLLKSFSGQLSRMKARDGNEELNKVCEENFRKDLTNSLKRDTISTTKERE